MQNAVRWISAAHYTVEANPGMGQAGLFYYYHSFAKAMTVLGEDNFADSKDVKHNWAPSIVRGSQLCAAPGRQAGLTRVIEPSAKRTPTWRRHSASTGVHGVLQSRENERLNACQ